MRFALRRRFGAFPLREVIVMLSSWVILAALFFIMPPIVTKIAMAFAR